MKPIRRGAAETASRRASSRNSVHPNPKEFPMNPSLVDLLQSEPRLATRLDLVTQLAHLLAVRHERGDHGALQPDALHVGAGRVVWDGPTDFARLPGRCEDRARGDIRRLGRLLLAALSRLPYADDAILSADGARGVGILRAALPKDRRFDDLIHRALDGEGIATGDEFYHALRACCAHRRWGERPREPADGAPSPGIARPEVRSSKADVDVRAPGAFVIVLRKWWAVALAAMLGWGAGEFFAFRPAVAPALRSPIIDHAHPPVEVALRVRPPGATVRLIDRATGLLACADAIAPADGLVRLRYERGRDYDLIVTKPGFRPVKHSGQWSNFPTAIHLQRKALAWPGPLGAFAAVGVWWILRRRWHR